MKALAEVASQKLMKTGIERIQEEAPKFIEDSMKNFQKSPIDDLAEVPI